VKGHRLNDSWLGPAQLWVFAAVFIIAIAFGLLAAGQASPPCGEYPCEITEQLR
jgi:hypothetical protein